VTSGLIGEISGNDDRNDNDIFLFFVQFRRDDLSRSGDMLGYQGKISFGTDYGHVACAQGILEVNHRKNVQWFGALAQRFSRSFSVLYVLES